MQNTRQSNAKVVLKIILAMTLRGFKSVAPTGLQPNLSESVVLYETYILNEWDAIYTVWNDMK